VFNYVSIYFPLAERPPQRISYFYFYQDRYAHEMVKVKFRDWDVKYTHIKPGEPVQVTLRGKHSNREFVGYIHEITPDITPGTNFVELTLIGASYKMKQAHQRVFENMTATHAVREIAKPYGFRIVADEHPRVYPQIVQAGHTDLEIMTRLAKQCGYTLRIEGTTLYFQSLTAEFTSGRASAARFDMREANNPSGSTLYSFKLNLGESIKYVDSYKSAAQIGGVDPRSNKSIIKTNPNHPYVLKETSTTEFFDSFSTDVVAPGPAEAAYEAHAIDLRNRFPYRASVEVIGTPSLTPDKPVYFSGLNKDYDGYWIVLSTIHKVVETRPNILTYTTLLEVGADSLGTAVEWVDGQTITAPSAAQVIPIVPGKKNKPQVTASVLKVGTNKTNNKGFAVAKNRKVTDTKGITGTIKPDAKQKPVPSLWEAKVKVITDSDNLVAKNPKSAAVHRRVSNRGD
jgi:phage protein D